MENEQEYIQDNFSTLRNNYQKYAALTLMIKSKVGKLIRFLFNRMQRQLWLWFIEDLESGKPIRWYLVKARQQGSTVWFIGLIYWLLTLRSNISALLLAQDEDAAESLGQKIQYLHFKVTDMLRPKVRKMNRSQIHFATDLATMEKTGDTGIDCVIDLSTADSEGIGRSRTYQYVLVTEFPLLPNLGINIPKLFTDLGNCVAEMPGTGIFLEGTSGGDNFAKDFWEDEKNGYRKIFISCVAEEQYRVNLPFGGPYPTLNTNPASDYGDEEEEFEKFKSQIPIWYPELNSVQVIHETFCRIVWRRQILDRKFFHPTYDERRVKFKQEYPITVEDAWSAESFTIFSLPRILDREDYLRKAQIKPKRLAYDSNYLNIGGEYFPFHPSDYGNLRIFEEPIPNTRYAIGGDAAQGIVGGDNSALVVLKLPHLEEVASIHGSIPPSEFAHIANYLGLHYNKALLGIELNDHGGHTANTILANILRYPNLYFVEGQNAYNLKYGFISNYITKQTMIADTKYLIHHNELFINSVEILKELRTYVDLGNDKYGAIKDGKSKDDLVSALMIAIQVAKSIHIPLPYEAPKQPPKGSPAYIYAQMDKRKFMRDRFKRG